ncbi:MAG TPA: T9SS type A sorting domain-containing protein [Chitinophagales bacterium]|nr:T9SS type A sorting domain-containing protein [Chitinophagales bacterium]HRK28347.1 T9SS type A sorting domain-containing protein [Chitinophagales bacterium]
MKIPFLVTLALLLTGQFMAAQNPFYRRTDVPVTAGGALLKYPWTGGLNNPQFSEADLNNDGIQDLVIFDRSSETFYTFLNGGTPNQTDYTYAPQYEAFFPALKNWALLTDFDCDGIADLFTGTVSADALLGDAIRVFKGQYTANNELTFSLHNNLLTYLPDNNKVYVAIYDIPALADVDNDGDLDILSFGPSGGYIKYYQNLSVENSLPCGTLLFDLGAECWGNFYESGISTTVDLGVDCAGGLIAPPVDAFSSGNTPSSHPNNHNPLPSLRSGLHPGSTLLAIDLDPPATSNGAKEMLLGDISFSNITMLTNGGTPQTANMIAQDTLFPSYTTPAIVTTFPAAFSADINNDGHKDLLVSPNTVAQSEHYRCVLLYRNNGSPTQQFQYVEDVFLVKDMIDVSRLAAPAFFDYNNDGLLDIAIANFGYMDEIGDFTTALALYRNIGAATQPAFELVSNNFSNISAQFALPRTGLRPTFGDLDGDGDPDMLLGDKDGFIHYFKNNPAPDGTAQFTLFQEQFQGLDVFQYSTPQLIDINKDGLLDLVIGHHNGALRYFQNNGTAANPVFNAATATNNFFGGVDVKEIGSPTGFSVPLIVEYKGQMLLFVGSESGKIHVYNNIEDNITTGGLFTKITDNLLNTAIGYRSSLAIADINNDGYLDMVVGAYNGGLYWFSEDFPIGLPQTATPLQTLQVFPNPAANHLTLQLPDAAAIVGFAQVELFNLSGQVVAQQNLLPAQTNHTLQLPALPAGLYFVRLTTAQKTFTAKLWVKQ